MTPDEMRDMAEAIGNISDDRAATAVWAVGAEICERLDRLLAQLDASFAKSAVNHTLDEALNSGDGSYKP